MFRFIASHSFALHRREPPDQMKKAKTVTLHFPKDGRVVLIGIAHCNQSTIN